MCAHPQAYQDELSSLGLKDTRIRDPSLSSSSFLLLWQIHILTRILVRLLMLLTLSTLTLPGLLLWSPIFLSARRAAARTARGGPVWDTHDELAQAKLVAGLFAGLAVYALAMALSGPLLGALTAVGVPALMWMTLRWLEDAVAAGRALFALVRILRLGPRKLAEVRRRREALHARVLELAVDRDGGEDALLGLPADPETFFVQQGAGKREKGRVRTPWEGKLKYFSVRRRRKRDWNETLRLYDVVDYPADDDI